MNQLIGALVFGVCVMAGAWAFDKIRDYFSEE